MGSLLEKSLFQSVMTKASNNSNYFLKCLIFIVFHITEKRDNRNNIVTMMFILFVCFVKNTDKIEATFYASYKYTYIHFVYLKGELFAQIVTICYML